MSARVVAVVAIVAFGVAGCPHQASTSRIEDCVAVAAAGSDAENASAARSAGTSLVVQAGQLWRCDCSATARASESDNGCALGGCAGFPGSFGCGLCTPPAAARTPHASALMGGSKERALIGGGRERELAGGSKEPALAGGSKELVSGSRAPLAGGDRPPPAPQCTRETSCTGFVLLHASPSTELVDAESVQRFPAGGCVDR